MKKENGESKIVSIIITVILIIILIVTAKLFKKNYYNGFEKAVTAEGKTNFTRDDKVKCSNSNSYKLENYEYNDSTFYKEIEVEPNTPYKITCKVKLENVEPEKNADSGVTIGLLDTTEYSKPIKGTSDWQQIEYMFNSRNRQKVKISYRLGGNDGDCIGTAWFSDLKVEKGTKRQDTDWRIGCYVIKEVNVDIEGKNYHYTTNTEDIENMKFNLKRFKQDCYTFSNKILNIDYDIIDVTTPLTQISHSEEHGYYFSYRDIENLIYDDVKQKEYDHVFVICRMEDVNGTNAIPINDNWIGLGSMDLYGIGYSLVRINKNSNVHTYKYGITNQLPEEVYLHEFLHTLERNLIDNGYDIPALHNYKDYGYSEKMSEGLKQWYQDYMRKRILDKTKNEYVGLYEIAYKTQPPNSSNFKYAVNIDFNNEPQNIFEDILSIIDAIKHRK